MNDFGSRTGSIFVRLAEESFEAAHGRLFVFFSGGRLSQMWGSIHQDKIVLLLEHLGIIGQILDVLQSSSDELSSP